MPPSVPVDPLGGSKLALSGRVVTMNSQFKVLARGAVYMDRGGIVAVKDAAAPPPAGFEGTRAVASGGTLFPGLIELHNHLAYDVLQLWKVPGSSRTGASGEARPTTVAWSPGP